MNILHLTVHLGGGIGTVLSNWVKLDTNNNHQIMCLNETYYNKYTDIVVYENIRNNKTLATEKIKECDILIVHFWNHPLLFEFLNNADIPECRMIFWSHISGINPPYVFTKNVLKMADMFVFSSPICFKAKEIGYVKDFDKFKVIWTTGDISNFSTVKKIPHDSFNVGYVGTVDYSKIHPNFVDMCSKIKIPNVKFIICGGGCDLEIMKKEVREKGLDHKFEFTGVVEDVKQYLSIMDVFGYPLNPNHFGTCEQVLGEAIMSGIVPVVMNNPSERYILSGKLSEYVCDYEEDYVDTIEEIYRTKAYDKIISEQIKTSIGNLYSNDKMKKEWNDVFFEVMFEDKSKKKLTNKKMNGYELFIESIGEHGKIIKSKDKTKIKNLFNTNHQWHSESKGSPKQYLKIFPEDEQLKTLCKILDG